MLPFRIPPANRNTYQSTPIDNEQANVHLCRILQV
jgi:ribosomal protein S4E